MTANYKNVFRVSPVKYIFAGMYTTVATNNIFTLLAFNKIEISESVHKF